MKIEIRDGCNVVFPFTLKDAFREAFPNAKWKSAAKQWQVAKGAEQRLQDWVAEVETSGILDQMRAQETARLAEAECDRLQQALARAKTGLDHEADATARATAAKSRSERLIEQLAAMEDRHRVLREQRDAAESAAHDAREAMMDKLREVADVHEIEQLRAGMKSDWRALKAVNRGRFEEKQSRLREIRSQLMAAGLESLALNKAVEANFNRRDRDLPDLSRALEFSVFKE